MLTIWKYRLAPVIEMPADHQFLSIQNQDGQPMLWFVVETNSPLKKYEFETIGTGDEIDFETEKYAVVGTYQMYNGTYVNHVFMKVEASDE